MPPANVPHRTEVAGPVRASPLPEAFPAAVPVPRPVVAVVPPVRPLEVVVVVAWARLFDDTVVVVFPA
jgi:hypothetical protein